MGHMVLQHSSRVRIGRVFYLSPRIEKIFDMAMLCIQYSICGLCITGLLSAGRSFTGRNCGGSGIFRLRIWFCGTNALHDAADCTRKHKTAHYAFATGIMNLGVMIPGMFSGMISDWIGYKMFFIWVLIATIPAFLVTLFVPFPHPENQKEQQINS